MANGRDQVEAEINIKAWKDPQFKKKLLENPRSALAEFGIKNIPASIRLSVVQEDERSWCIVLHNQNSKKATEKELKELMAGQEEELGCSAAGG